MLPLSSFTNYPILRIFDETLQVLNEVGRVNVVVTLKLLEEQLVRLKTTQAHERDIVFSGVVLVILLGLFYPLLGLLSSLVIIYGVYSYRVTSRKIRRLSSLISEIMDSLASV